MKEKSVANRGRYLFCIVFLSSVLCPGASNASREKELLPIKKLGGRKGGKVVTVIQSVCFFLVLKELELIGRLKALTLSSSRSRMEITGRRPVGASQDFHQGGEIFPSRSDAIWAMLLLLLLPHGKGRKVFLIFPAFVIFDDWLRWPARVDPFTPLTRESLSRTWRKKFEIN